VSHGRAIPWTLSLFAVWPFIFLLVFLLLAPILAAVELFLWSKTVPDEEGTKKGAAGKSAMLAWLRWSLLACGRPPPCGPYLAGPTRGVQTNLYSWERAEETATAS